MENHPAHSGNAGTEIVVRAPADGYTILLCQPANAISGSLYPNLPFSFLRDMTPVTGITREALVEGASFGSSKDDTEFAAYAKANLDKIKMASTGNRSAPRMSPASCTSRCQISLCRLCTTVAVVPR